MSINKCEASKMTIDNGNSVEVKNINNTMPFSIVIQSNSGEVKFYNKAGVEANILKKTL